MFENKQGHAVPQVTFRTRRNHDWVNLTSDELFAGKNVVVFSLPGAFTPTCSSSHVPRYNQLAKTLKANGVDEIVCISVNDAFVMNQWKAEQQADNIRFVPDGNGEFTNGMGLLVDKADLGFGKRSWRYSMLVKDGVIDKLFIEPEKAGDPFEVSDADTMLEYISPGGSKPLNVAIFTRPNCTYCVQAKTLLSELDIDYEELVLGRDYTDQTLRAVANASSFPQIFVDGQLIGGADDLQGWLQAKQAA